MVGTLVYVWKLSLHGKSALLPYSIWLFEVAGGG